MNIIIPLAGYGKRFLMEGYVRPKPFIRVNGKEILLWLLENLSLTHIDNLIFVYNTNPHLGMSPENFFTTVTDYVASRPPKTRPSVRFIPLSTGTVGSAETVLRALESLSTDDLKRPAVLLDGDTFYSHDILKDYRTFLAGDDGLSPGGLVFVFDDDRSDAPYSYVKVSESFELSTSNIFSVTNIKEKDKTDMSPLACSGCYCFNSSAELRVFISKAFVAHERKRTAAESSSVELYTSCVISDMIQSGRHFAALRLLCDDFTVLGTPAQLKDFMARTACPPKRFCFDLDGTLVTAPRIPGDYTTCEPIHHMIQYLQQLHENGHYIIIHTARRMRTHGGNTGAVLSDVGSITLNQLKQFHVPHDEVHFGKPFADFYVDDKAVVALVDDISKETGVSPKPKSAGNFEAS